MPPNVRRDCAISLFLIVAIAAIYWPVSGHGFSVLDDDDYVVHNTRVQSGLTWDGFTWAMTTDAVANWHPLTWLSHMLDCQIFGVRAGAHHLVNVFFHAANTVLLFWVLKRLTGAAWPSAFVAALFGLHPLHVESVAWISERKDVLSTFFWLLAMAAYSAYVRKRSVWRYLLIVAPFALGLMAKPMLVTLPCVLLLLDYWPLDRFYGPPAGKKKVRAFSRSAIIEKVPLFVVALASSIITYIVQQGGGAVRSFGAMPLGQRLGNAAVGYVRYLAKTVWPSDLSVYYPHPGSGLPLWQIAGAVIVLIAISAIVIRLAPRHRYLAVGWLWYLGTLVPVIGLIQVGSQAIADRYMYVPIIGLFIMAVWGAPGLAQWLAARVVRRGKGAVAAQPPDGTSLPAWGTRANLVASLVSAGLLLAYGVAAARQVNVWQDNVTLFDHAVRVTTDNDVGEFNLGIALKRAGRLDEAAEHFTEALRIRANYVNAHIYLGLIRYEQHRYDEAVKHYQDALEYAAGHPNHADALNNLGVTLFAQGKLEEAVKQYNMSVQINPRDANTHYNLGNALMSLGRRDEAGAQFREALRLQPNHQPAQNALAQLGSAPAAPQPAIEVPKLQSAEEYFSRGNALADKSKFAEAAAYYQEAVRLKPEYLDARINLGNALAVQGKLREAAVQFREALKAAPNNPDAHVNLGNALSELGELEDSAKEYAAAVRLKPNHVDARCSHGYVLVKLGKVDEAAAEFQKALSLDPKCDRARDALKQIDAHRKRQ